MKIYAYAAMLLTGIMAVSCSKDDSNGSDADLKKSIVILYENDVHCGIDGYTQMQGLRDAIVRSDTSFVGYGERWRLPAG